MAELDVVGASVVLLKTTASCSRVTALILKRSPDASWGPNLWNLPGGWINSGETPADTAKRECEEEAGLTPLDLKFLRT